MTQKTRILFVDDEQLVLSALRRTLPHDELECWFTQEAEAAMGIVAEYGIDVVVTDHHMPTMTGVELLSMMRRLQPHVGRVLITGQADLQMSIQAVNEGAVHRILEKPWDERTIVRMLRGAHMEARQSSAGRTKARETGSAAEMTAVEGGRAKA